MSSLANIIANANSCALLLFITLGLSGFITKNKIIRFLGLIILPFIFYILPVYHGFSLVKITRGIVGDLSITGLLTMLSITVSYFMTNKQDKSKPILSISICMFLVITGVFLYLSTFGYIGLDIYALGYHPTVKLLLIILVVESCMWFLSRRFALIWLLSLLAFYFELQYSSNLWDYLFDPVLWILAIRGLFNSALLYRIKLLIAN